MKIITVHQSQSPEVELFTDFNGRAIFTDNSELTMTIHEDMVRYVNELGCEDTEVSTVRELQKLGWYVTEEKDDNIHRLTLMAADPASDPECNQRIYNIITLPAADEGSDDLFFTDAVKQKRRYEDILINALESAINESEKATKKIDLCHEDHAGRTGYDRL